MDDIRADPIGFRSLVEGQPTSSAPLVSVSQRPIVPVEQKPVTALCCICQNRHLPRAAGHGGGGGLDGRPEVSAAGDPLP